MPRAATGLRHPTSVAARVDLNSGTTSDSGARPASPHESAGYRRASRPHRRACRPNRHDKRPSTRPASARESTHYRQASRPTRTSPRVGQQPPGESTDPARVDPLPPGQPTQQPARVDL